MVEISNDELPIFGRMEDIREGDLLPEIGLDSRALLRAVVNISPLAIVLTDPYQPDYPVIFCNPAFSRLTGYSREETIGRNCRFLQGAETDPAAVQLLGQTMAAKAEAQVDLWNYRKDGTRFWNSMFVGPVFGQDGRLLYYFGSQADATARREVEEARSRAQRMDTLGSMAAGIAHEVNNLMTVVIGNAERLSSGSADAKQLERLERIDWAARAAGKLTQQMLSFAGRQALHVGIADLNEVLRNFDSLLAQVSASKVSVEVNLHREAIRARVDVGQLKLALINLVRNASDASPDGNPVVITTYPSVEGGLDMVEVCVTDQGSGMPPEVAAKATEPFFTTKEAGKGTGLGLSMVAGFCQQSGGRMVIETEIGRGTAVRLIFPRSDYPATT